MNENIERALAELDGFRMCDEMTYSAYSILYDEISLLDDLLKDQEPKVMTLEELLDKRQFSNNVRPIWIECRNGNVDAFVLIYTEYIGDNDTVTTIGQGAYVQVSWRQGDYGKEWRAWDALPSEEQRRNTAWIADDK